VQQCASSGGGAVQSICARGYVSVSCTTAMIDTIGAITTCFYLTL
jgi:energy-converting hydrogenase Eha subunit C